MPSVIIEKNLDIGKGQEFLLVVEWRNLSSTIHTGNQIISNPCPKWDGMLLTSQQLSMVIGQHHQIVCV